MCFRGGGGSAEYGQRPYFYNNKKIGPFPYTKYFDIYGENGWFLRYNILHMENKIYHV